MSTITDRQKSMLQLRAAHHRNARPTGGAFADLLTPLLAAGEQLPDLELMQNLLLRLLEQAWQRLSTTDEACRELLERQGSSVVERDVATSRLYREVVDLRRMLTGMLDRESTAWLLGLRGNTAQDPVVLLRQAGRATGRLYDPDRPMPPSPRPSPVCDRATDRARWAKPVAGAAEHLQRLVDAVARTAKEIDAARLERRQALEDFNQTFIAAASWLVATYHLVGHDHRAAAVRPSRQYPGRTARDVRQKTRKRTASSPEKTAKPLPFPKLRPILRFLGGRRQSS